jgi:hypothetical protein
MKICLLSSEEENTFYFHPRMKHSLILKRSALGAASKHYL